MSKLSRKKKDSKKKLKQIEIKSLKKEISKSQNEGKKS